MSYADDIRAHRAKLQEIDRELLPVEAGVEPATASALVGRARAMLRAASQILGNALREQLDGGAPR